MKKLKILLAALLVIGSTAKAQVVYGENEKEYITLGARNRYALRLADHQRSSPGLCGLGPPYYSLLR